MNKKTTRSFKRVIDIFIQLLISKYLGFLRLLFDQAIQSKHQIVKNIDTLSEMLILLIFILFISN